MCNVICTSLNYNNINDIIQLKNNTFTIDY